MTPTLWIVALFVACSLVALIVWLAAGARGVARGAERERESLRAGLRRLGSGDSSTPGQHEVVEEALREGWIQRPGPSVDTVRHEAVGRVVAFLQGAVAKPLEAAIVDAPEAIRRGLEEVVGALQDLEFYAADRTPAPGEADLVRVAREVVREFVSDSSVAVKEVLPAGSVRVQVDVQALKDAIYLIFHNAAEFGGGTTVSVEVGSGGTGPELRIRDRGPGFDAESFRRAMDPFYSTSETGLGLGLARARQLIEAMGGQVSLRNHPESGAEVVLTLR